MKKRIKDLSFALRLPLSLLNDLANQLDQDESVLYRNWDEPKTDEFNLPRFENGVALTRPINAPVAKLKLAQSRLLRNVLYKIPLPEYYYGGIKKKDAVLNSRYHQGNKFFFLTDLKNFYPSISSKNVEKALRAFGFYPEVARLITRLSTRGGCIPQGCPTSSFLASLVVENNCSDLFKAYQKDGLKVSIYVDDITISSPVDFKLRTNSIIRELRERGLKINFAKTHYCSFNPVVTGVVVKNNGICALPHNYDRAKDSKRKVSSREGYIQRIKYIEKISKNAP